MMFPTKKPRRTFPEFSDTHFQFLPTELLPEIFQYLGIKSLSRASRVCKTWKIHAFSQTLWKNLENRYSVLFMSISESNTFFQKVPDASDFGKLLEISQQLKKSIYLHNAETLLHKIFKWKIQDLEFLLKDEKILDFLKVNASLLITSFVRDVILRNAPLASIPLFQQMFIDQEKEMLD
jgi:hypothetical protein